MANDYRHVRIYPEEIIHRATDRLHQARHADRISCVCLVSGIYLAFPTPITGPLQTAPWTLLPALVITETRTHINPDLRRWPSTERSKFIRVMEVAITTTKNIWQPEPYTTIAVDEEDG
jgi:hypothetical protein